MRSRSAGAAPRSTIFGVALVLVGAFLLLRELGVVPAISVWTLLWLGAGGFLVAAALSGGRRGWFAPLAVLGVGVLLLLRDLEVISRRPALWPIVIIALGASMLIDAGRRPDRETPRVWR